MTNFAQQIRHQGTDYAVRSLMDIDFYKLTMSYFIFKFYRGHNVKFKLINRNKDIPLANIIPINELKKQLDHVRTLRFRKTDLYYLRGMDIYGMNMFDEEFLAFLKNVQLGDYTLERNRDQYELTFEGPWEAVTLWETIALAIVSELYYRNLMKYMTDIERSIMYGRATDKLYQKLTFIKEHAPNVKIADFGQRRRHSFLWQQYAINLAKDILGNSFTGSSNTWMAFNQDLVPIGTNAHELWSVVTALADNKVRAQYDVMKKWKTLFDKGLRVILPDTYTTDAFLENMSVEERIEVANEWKGFRQDSGNSIDEANKYINFWKENGVNPKDKLVIFSDGLTEQAIVDLYTEFNSVTNVAFGWGTMLTNDFIGCLPNPYKIIPGTEKTFSDLFKPFSMVCKAVEADGNQVIKLSNNPNKATGDKDTVEKYMKTFVRTTLNTQETLI